MKDQNPDQPERKWPNQFFLNFFYFFIILVLDFEMFLLDVTKC